MRNKIKSRGDFLRRLGKSTRSPPRNILLEQKFKSFEWLACHILIYVEFAWNQPLVGRKINNTILTLYCHVKIYCIARRCLHSNQEPHEFFHVISIFDIVIIEIMLLILYYRYCSKLCFFSCVNSGYYHNHTLLSI